MPQQVSSPSAIASRNDPRMSFERPNTGVASGRCRCLTPARWAINAQSGHGDWHQGRNLLNTLYRRGRDGGGSGQGRMAPGWCLSFR